ncbi:MAG TPA: polyphenol oxidase family protein [Thermoanaerobaculia bacterium]|nr:polyphenol oxidase family protein [Thermoanaerobaculia bacterium]
MDAWREDTLDGIPIFRPMDAPRPLVVAFSGRGSAPPDEASPTAFLARRVARALGLDGTPLVRATQVHGTRSVAIRNSPAIGETTDAGACDVLATALSGVALVVQTADCVPVVLAAPTAIATAHAGWRGTAADAAGAAVRALGQLGAEPGTVRAWLGPAIGSCCYEVGGEVASQFAGEFLRPSCRGRSFLDLAAINRAQLEAAGVAPGSISAFPGCTRCGGEKFASYRRDGAAAGRMIGLVVRAPG